MRPTQEASRDATQRKTRLQFFVTIRINTLYVADSRLLDTREATCNPPTTIRTMCNFLWWWYELAHREGQIFQRKGQRGRGQGHRKI